MTPATVSPPPRPSLLARFGPLAAILVALGLVAALASTGRDQVASTASGPGSEVGSAKSDIPITFEQAQKEGKVADYDFGSKCDLKTGRVKIPSTYAPPCVVAPEGVEGGATYRGVTADTIKVVAYEPADDDLSASLQDQSDTPDQARDTRNKLIEMMASTYETWGRKIEVVPMKGSGSDETSARADAVKVAEEIKAFASIGGPGQESAYAEELARRKVLCIGCGLASPDSTFQKYAPFLWGNTQPPEQYLLNLGDFIIERLLGYKAEFAGDEATRQKDRVFGVVHFEQDPPVFGGVEEMVAKEGGARGYDAAVNLTYQLVIADLPEKARVLVARLKEAGVTSVIFLGDPVMPIYLTKAATDQDYHPEWIITGTVLTDTTVFGRLYDQDQWAHAFGISGLPARLPQKKGEAWRLYEWYYGTEPEAKGTIAVINEPIRLFMLGVHMAGPNLTPETFRDGLFNYPPTGGTPTAPQVSFGDHGIFANPDYNAVDDMGVIWWDAEATGLDEQGTEGTGMMRYADGGRRYLPGEMPHEPANVFQVEGSVLGYDEVPADELPPDYPSPGPAGN
ncbi:MAG: ABC transporter substrate-binding protein [Acidimicrobiales bacterium]|nr:ABC transporter substrate-binding protein [Acidimicrobiales bacterium]